MPADKGKAYELEMLERKEQEKRNALTTLSDYWNTEDKKSLMMNFPKKTKTAAMALAEVREETAILH